MAQRNGSYTPFQHTPIFNRYQLRGDHLRGPQGALHRLRYQLASNHPMQQGMRNENNSGVVTSQSMVPFASTNATARQGSLLRAQNHFISPSNFLLGRNHAKNIGDSNSQSMVPMVPLASSSNTNGSLPATRYGGILPWSLTRNPPSPMGTLNMSGHHGSHFDFGESSSSINVGLQGSTKIGFPNSVETTIHNAETNSLHPSQNLTDNSPLFKDFNVDVNKLLHNVKDQFNIGRPTPGDLLPTSNHNQTPEPSNPNGNFKRISLEKALKRPLFEVDGIEEIMDSSSKKPMIFIPAPFFGGLGKINKPLKELDLFKDEENEQPPAPNEAIEEPENLDLSLQL